MSSSDPINILNLDLTNPAGSTFSTGPVSVGDILCFKGWTTGVDTGLTVHDPVNGDWPQKGTRLATVGGRTLTRFEVVNAGAGTHTATVTWGGGAPYVDGPYFALPNVTGADKMIELDPYNGGANTNTPTTGPSGTLAQASEVVVVTMLNGSSVALSQGAGYALMVPVNSQLLLCEWKTVSSTASFTGTANAAGGGATGIIILETYKCAPGAAAQLAVVTQPPPTALSDRVFDTAIVVEVQDAAGTRVTSDTSTVTATINQLTGEAQLHGTVSKANVAGRTTWADLFTDDSDGATWTITFSNGSLTDAVTITMTGAVRSNDSPAMTTF